MGETSTDQVLHFSTAEDKNGQAVWMTIVHFDNKKIWILVAVT